jgi:hypothetical protein
MPEFQTGDVVRVEMPRGYSGRGVLGISLLFSTSPESRFEGAIGTVTEINPVGPQAVHQYLVDFRTHDNGRIGIPWQAQWFREEWLALKERPDVAVTAATARNAAEATWPDRPAEPAAAGPGGIAHPEAKLFTEGRADFAPPGLDPEQATGTVPPAAYGIGGQSAAPTEDVETATAPESQAFTGTDRADDRSGRDAPAFEPTLESMSGPVDTTTPSSAPGTMDIPSESAEGDLIVERGEGFVKVRGMSICPDGFPIKGNANSGIFHAPTDSSYARTIPEICFASEEIAVLNGFRAPGRRG